MSYLSTDEAYDYATLACWYQNSIDETQPPIWTDEHLEELLKDFYIIPKDTPSADVVPKSEVEELEAECERQYEQAKADILANMADSGTSCHWCIDEHKAQAKAEVAREIFEEIEFDICQLDFDRDETRSIAIEGIIATLKKEYTEDKK